MTTPTADERVAALTARHTRVVQQCAGASVVTGLLTPELAADIATAIREAEAAVRNEDCRAVCPHCRDGVPALRTESGGWRHDDWYGSPCIASALRDLPPGAP